jgi:calcium-dependent protein kinase
MTSGIKISASNFVRVQEGGLSSDYQVQEVLGQGGFAVVNKCVHIPTGQARAVKTVHKSGLNAEHTDPKYRLREIRVLRTLDHPNILRCYELFEDRSRFYIVMELCSGGELFDAIAKRRSLSEAQAAKVMHQLLSCVAYCHEKKVIHRDLKPENILLEDNDGELNIKVADFGSSAFIDPSGRLSGCFGSAYYVAPEVVEGSAYNEKCDLWSCGIILFIMLTGKPPYEGTNERQILENVRRKPFNPSNYQFNGVSSEAIDLIYKLLKIDSRQRLSAAEAVNHPWVQHYRTNASTLELNSALQNLRGFNSNYKLKDAVYTFLATNVITQAETRSLRETFQAVDINSDGRLSSEELLRLYMSFTHEREAHREVEKILAEVDSDKSGFVDYSEFLKACMNYEKVVSKSNLEIAFNAFDTDGSGSISAQELKEVLSGGQSLQDDVWRELIGEVDSNGDGTIDLKEFTHLMLSKI